ncbi:MAG: CPBP family intramembrane metalloprotease [Phycisphaerales bacterium]|nr:CPBP family intramembrane metalloprotease [Phycisphaerales bacterium]
MASRRSASGPERASGSGTTTRVSREGYFDRSRQPLEILAFVAPLVVIYEIGLVYALRTTGGTLTNGAHEELVRFFSSIGIDPARLSVPALGLPGVGLLLVLILWQLLVRRPWTLHIPTVGLMVLESILLALPLLVLAQVVSRAFIPAGPEALPQLSTFGGISMCIGAGLYEELIFRMVLFSLLHTIFVNLFRMPERWGIVLSIALSALLFALYHPIRTSAGAIDLRRATFFVLAGGFFGVLYIVRGFGIVVGAHAFYDIAAVVLFSNE